MDGLFGPIWKCVVQSPFRLMGDAAEDILQCFRPTHLLIAIAQHVPCVCFESTEDSIGPGASA